MPEIFVNVQYIILVHLIVKDGFLGHRVVLHASFSQLEYTGLQCTVIAVT